MLKSRSAHDENIVARRPLHFFSDLLSRMFGDEKSRVFGIEIGKVVVKIEKKMTIGRIITGVRDNIIIAGGNFVIIFRRQDPVANSNYSCT